MNDDLENKIKERTKELRDSNDRFQLVIENIEQALWMANADRSQFFFVSPSYEKIFGRTPQSLLDDPKSFENAIHPDDRSMVIAAFKKRLTSGGRDLPYRIVKPDGGIRWVRSHASVVSDESGKPFRLFGVVTDITESQEALRAEQAAITASELKSEFLANMSHEIRTPINGVMGMAHILLSTELTSEQKEFADNIIRSAENLLFLVNDILDLSKAESGKIDLEIIDFDLEEVIGDIERTLMPAARENGLCLKRTAPSQFTRFLRGDPHRLRQIIMNLASNAIKFTREGHVAILVGEEALPNGRYRIRFEIEDTGIGIPPSAMNRLFHSFSQADASTSRRFGGTGLGLAISKRLVNLMGGEIGVDSTEGVGSTFWFLIELEAATARVTQTPAHVVTKAKTRRQILVAEDIYVNRLVAVKMLENMGHVVTAVANGFEVVEALKNGVYELILMDCQMPGMDGFEATRIIRSSREQNCQGIKIIAMTANAMASDREKCLTSGMDDFTTKPIRPVDLHAAIERVFAKKIKAA